MRHFYLKTVAISDEVLEQYLQQTILKVRDILLVLDGWIDFYVKTGVRFSLRDKRLFEITEVEITRVDCITPIALELRIQVRLLSFAYTLHMVFSIAQQSQSSLREADK